MKGIQFVVDENGKQTAVVIDLKEHGLIWEDFYDNLLIEQRVNGPMETLEEAKKKVLGKSSGV